MLCVCVCVCERERERERQSERERDRARAPKPQNPIIKNNSLFIMIFCACWVASDSCLFLTSAGSSFRLWLRSMLKAGWQLKTKNHLIYSSFGCSWTLLNLALPTQPELSARLQAVVLGRTWAPPASLSACWAVCQKKVFTDQHSHWVWCRGFCFLVAWSCAAVASTPEPVLTLDSWTSPG